MGGVRVGGILASIVALGAVGLTAGPARAIEAWDGRFQLHGFYENQTRVMARNFRATDDWDLTQWYQVLNLEMELDIAPDGWGPFDLISGYARVEARFDCVWDRACGVFQSANTFGDRAGKLPKRLADGRRDGFTDNQFTGDVRKRPGIPREFLGFEHGVQPPPGASNPGIFLNGQREPAQVFHVPGIDTLFGQEGANGVLGDGDDPAPFILSRFDDFEFGLRKVRGSSNGVGTQILGPWLPKNFVDPIGALKDKPNPFNSLDFNPILPARNGAGDFLDVNGNVLASLDETVASCGQARDAGFAGFNPAGCLGSAAQPYRPAPSIAAGSTANQRMAQGIYYPNPGLARAIREDNFDALDQNFRESELKWNRGASQQQTHFLKEAYLDIEMLDSSLWLRLGRQSIVWGKTELFRTTDQFNPQDLALSTLPSLEESRIPLWAFRAVYNLWSVGPLQDFRIEFAANIDHFEGADFGQCGEPYTVNAACNLRAGMFAHGITGFGLAGVTRPPDPWQDIKGLETGIRIEFRWSRFSFAITDFYGYDDFPFVDQLFRYERNVDPFTGRPREGNSRGECTTGNEDACLTPAEALTEHHANQQLFAFICSTSIAFAADLDPTVCAQSVFNSQLGPLAGLGLGISGIIGGAITGDPSGISVGALVLGTLINNPALNPTVEEIPFVDLGLGVAGGNPGNDPVAIFPTFPRIDDHLSDAQKGLLGCGPLFGQAGANPCETNGFDLLNAEASALTSAWITQPGVRGSSYLDLTGPAPGSVGYVQEFGRFHCQRFVNGVGLVVLPGCRAPGENGYVAAIDGVPAGIGVNEAGLDVAGNNNGASPFAALFNCPDPVADNPAGTGLAGGLCGAGNPFTGEQFYSFMDAFSFNFQMLLVVFSAIGSDNNGDGVVEESEIEINEFNPARPLATDRCSWAAPQFCSNVQALLSVMGRRRNTIFAGGNANFGRHDFAWHGGTSNRLKWEKRNVLGFSMDFAEDVTKSNWSVETTWIHDLKTADNEAIDGIKEVDHYNLTVSVDRPTFINFLNQNRTFFINSQWFFRYIDGFEQSQPQNGPFNVLATLSVFTGFYQDRLNPNLTLVYDFMSESGAVLPSISYRFTESFSVEFGMALFYGKWQSTRMALNPVSLGEQVGSGAYRDFSERGLALVRGRDEVFLRLRKTF